MSIRKEFDDIMHFAELGDANALKNLPETAKKFLAESRKFLNQNDLLSEELFAERKNAMALYEEMKNLAREHDEAKANLSQKTDRERLEELLKRFEIPYTAEKDSIWCEERSGGKIEGYTGFFAKFEFNDQGCFIKMVLGE